MCLGSTPPLPRLAKADEIAERDRRTTGLADDARGNRDEDEKDPFLPRPRRIS